MCVMITCYRVLSLKFIEIHFTFNMASVKNKIGYPAMKITFLLSDLNLSRIKVTSHLHGCPSKLYVGGKLNNCSLRWKYNLSGFFCQEVSGAGKVWNDWGLFYSNLSGIGCHSTSKMAAQSYSQGIHQLPCAKPFRYSDWLSRYRHLSWSS